MRARLDALLSSKVTERVNNSGSRDASCSCRREVCTLLCVLVTTVRDLKDVEWDIEDVDAFFIENLSGSPSIAQCNELNIKMEPLKKRIRELHHKMQETADTILDKIECPCGGDTP